MQTYIYKTTYTHKNLLASFMIYRCRFNSIFC